MGGAPFSIDAEDEAETMLHRADMGRSSAAPVRNRGGGCWAESDRRLSHDVTDDCGKTRWPGGAFEAQDKQARPTGVIDACGILWRWCGRRVGVFLW
jgi:hypothetical protein